MENLIKRYPALKDMEDKITNALSIMEKCYRNGGKIMLIGNGGSSADCSHIAGELLKDFYIKRPIESEFSKKLSAISKSAEETALKLQKGIPCIDLTALTGALTALGNDTGYEYAFAQLFYSLYRDGDVLIAFSTSGTSKNVIKALEIAKVLNAKTITFTGKNGLKDESLSTVTLSVPETETYLAQELHLPIYHYLCKELERKLFG